MCTAGLIERSNETGRFLYGNHVLVTMYPRRFPVSLPAVELGKALFEFAT